MNKKHYIQPVMEVVHLNTTQGLLAGSLGNGDSPQINFGYVPVDDSGSGYYAD